MRLLLLILVAGAVAGGANAQFRGANLRTRFDSDEFDNDFDDRFDRRSRERNSIERDSFERISLGRTNNNNNRLFRDSIEDNSFEIRRVVGSNRNANNNNNNFVVVRDSLERDSIEIRRPFGSNFNTNSQRANNNNFRSQGFRRDSPERDSFEIQIPLRNVPQSIINPNLGAAGFRRGSFESVEIRNPFLSAAQRNTNRNSGFGFRRDSNERDNSIEVRVPVTNPRSGVSGFRTVSIERDSFEIARPFGGSRQQPSPSLNASPRPSGRQPTRFFRVSLEDDSSERNINRNVLNQQVTNQLNAIIAANRIPNTSNRQNNNNFGRPLPTPNRNQASSFGTNAAARNPVNHFGGRGSVLRFDSFEHNSLERDSLEDLIEDLTDDDADDRARARLALQRLGRLPGGTTTPSRSSGATNDHFGRPLGATSSGGVNPFGRPVTLTNNRAGAPAPTTNINNSPFGRPLNANNNRNVLNQEVTNQLNAIIASNRIPTPSNRPRSNTNFGVPLPTPNRNQASNSGTTNLGSSGRTSNTSRFPPLPVSPINQGLRTTSRINSNTLVSTNNNFNSNNNNRFNLNENRFNVNNNPFLSRTSNQDRPASPRVTTTTTTPRPITLATPKRLPPPPTPATRTFAPTTTTTPRPQAQPQRFSSSSASIPANPFQTAARLNNVDISGSGKPSANPFINPSTRTETKKSSSSSSSSSSRNSLKTGPRKSIPAVVPMGFEWPGGNGYYFRMSTGNSKPIQYFISYDD